MLEINPADVRECPGTTVRGKPCTNPNNVADRRVASIMIGELSRIDIVAEGLSNETKELVQQIANLTLCKKSHRRKQEDLTRKWLPAMREHIAGGRGIIQELERPRPAAAAAVPRQVPVAQHQPPPHQRVPLRRAANPPPQQEARVDPEPAQRVRDRAPAPAPRPLLAMPRQHIRVPAPVADGAMYQRAARLEVQDHYRAPPALPPIGPRQPRPYQAPPVIPIREQVRNIPVRPASPVAPLPMARVEAAFQAAVRRREAARVDGTRKPLERGCYVYYEDFDGPGSAVWCRKCGQNLHIECFRDWSLGKRREDLSCAY